MAAGATRAGAGRCWLLGGTAVMLAACSTATPSPTGLAGDVGVRSQGDAVAEVPAVVAAGPTADGRGVPPVSYAYVSESNRILLFDQTSQRLTPDVELDAVPQEIAAGKAGTLVLGFASGDVAVIDAVTRRQVSRASLASLRERALGGDISLDEVLVDAEGTVVLVGRIADEEAGQYRSFVQERDGHDLSLLREEVLPPSLGVVQDVAAGPAGAVRFLLSDGRVYDRRTDAGTDPGAGPDGQVLRYGPAGERWIGSGDAKPGVLTPQDVFVPIAAGRVSDIVPLRQGAAAVLVSQPPQVWLVASSGEVLSRTDTDDYPYAGALVGERLHIGSANGDRLQLLNPTSGAIQQQLPLGQGIVAIGTLRGR